MKIKTVYRCRECGAESLRWSGKCSMCDSWNTLVEVEVESKTQHKSSARKQSDNQPVRFSQIQDSQIERISTGIQELDRTLGGGIVQGSFVLIGGDPGIGKSTLLLQMCAELKDETTLYVTGEESIHQINQRAKRLNATHDNILVLAETSLERILYAIENTECRIIIIDSIQSIRTEYADATAGSVVQIRECGQALMNTAKLNNKAIFIIGHVTKEGIIAGPKVLEHIVDTVLLFEGSKNYSYRILRAMKNRFGSTNEIGIFEMSGYGLREVLNPSEVFLSTRDNNDSGIALSAAIEGTLPIIAEVQALVGASNYGVPQRSSNIFDIKRLQMILAVLEKRLGLNFGHNDIFVNIAGGFSINDTSLDLAVAGAIVSSFQDKTIDNKTVLIGEIGLTGEVRSVQYMEKRILEVQKLGFNRVITPILPKDIKKEKFTLEIVPVGKITDALREIL